MTYKPCSVYLIFQLNKDNWQFAKLSSPAQLKNTVFAVWSSGLEGFWEQELANRFLLLIHLLKGNFSIYRSIQLDWEVASILSVKKTGYFMGCSLGFLVESFVSSKSI